MGLGYALEDVDICVSCGIVGKWMVTDAMQGPILVKLGVCCHYQEKSSEGVWRGRRSGTVKGFT
jgi:hypothetical protein